MAVVAEGNTDPMKPVLLAYATVDGLSRRIAERIERRIIAAGFTVQCVEADSLDTVTPGDFCGIIAGSPVRYGKHDPRIAAFLERHAASIEARPNAFFSVNLVARTPEKRTPQGNSHVRKFLASLRFKPEHVEVIAGRLDYPSYGWLDRLAIRMIMKMTGGPTGGTEVIEYTDWDQVDRFADCMTERMRNAT